jgi:hypothetical protein
MVLKRVERKTTLIVLLIVALGFTWLYVIRVTRKSNFNIYVYASGTFNVYADPACTILATSLNWGNCSPGSVHHNILYMFNDQDLNVSLSMNTTSWSPAIAQIYITESWNYTDGTMMLPHSIEAVDIVLNISQNIVNVTDFSYNTNIFAQTIQDYYQFTFDFKDWNGNSTSAVTWHLYNGSQNLNYVSGNCSLPPANYTLKVYYGPTLLRTMLLPTTTYGNSTVTVDLNIIPQTYGLIALNGSVTNLTIMSQTANDLQFIANGTSGPYILTIGVPKMPSGVTKDGVMLASGVDWIYNSTRNVIVITTNTLSVWHIMFASSPPPPPITSYTLTTIVTNRAQNLSGIPVTISGGYSAITGADGTASFVLPQGTYTISIAYQGTTQSKTVDLISDQQVLFDVSSQPPISLITEYFIGILTIAIISVVAVGVVTTRRRKY